LTLAPLRLGLSQDCTGFFARGTTMSPSSSFPSSDASAAAADMKIQEAAAVLDDAVDDISRKGRVPAQGARDLLTVLDETVRKAARTRPYTTLAIAGLTGFLYAAARRQAGGRAPGRE
jgi:hypothetical protein